MQRMRKGLTHTCSDDDPDERYKFVIRSLKGPQGAPIIAGFREGDSEKGAWVQQPPGRVRALGGQILAQVNRSNTRNVNLNAVHAWHKVFVPRYPEVRAPGGGQWKASEQMEADRVQRAMRVSGKALAADGVQNDLWEKS